MLTLKDKGLLFYIIEHCKRIEEKIKDKSKDTSFNPRVCMYLQHCYLLHSIIVITNYCICVSIVMLFSL